MKRILPNLQSLAPRIVSHSDMLPSHLGGKTRESADCVSESSKKFWGQVVAKSTISPSWFGLIELGNEELKTAAQMVRNNGNMSENISKILIERFHSLSGDQLSWLITMLVSTSSPDKLQIRGTHERRALKLIENNFDTIKELPLEGLCNSVELFCSQKTHQQTVVPELLDVIVERIDSEEGTTPSAIRTLCEFAWIISKSDVDILTIFNVLASHLSLYVLLIHSRKLGKTISAFIDCGVAEARDTFLNSVHPVIHTMQSDDIMKLITSLSHSRHSNIPMIKTVGQQEWLKLPGFKN